MSSCLEWLGSLPREEAETHLLTCNASPTWARKTVTSTAAKHRSGREARWSADEQSGASDADDPVWADLASWNVMYEEHFGHVFLIRAAGRSAAEMLAELQHRIGNPVADEQLVVRRELADITRPADTEAPGRPMSPSMPSPLLSNPPSPRTGAAERCRTCVEPISRGLQWISCNREAGPKRSS